MEPETRYARTGGIAIAYQVVGDGEHDLVYVPDYMSNLGCSTSEAPASPVTAASSQRSRRGWRTPLRARCGRLGQGRGRDISRTRALVLFHPEVRGVLQERGDASDAGLRELIELCDRWGSQEFADDLLQGLCPTLYASEEDRRQFAN